MIVSRLFIFAALIVANSSPAVDNGLFNRVPSGPREQRRAGWISARGALPTRLNACAILNCARYRPTLVWPQSLLPGFQLAPPFDEQVSWRRLDCGVRVFVNAPTTQGARSRVLVVYATPNGSTIEQTLGCAASKELDWRFDIQHVGAQLRRLREIDAEHEFVLAVLQAPKLSWPTFRREQSLYVGQVDWYVDYSHGIRLMSQQIIVDNQSMKVSDVLKDTRLCPLLSTERPIDVADVRNAAGWGR